MSIERETLLEMYLRMNQARAFEEKVKWGFARGMIHGTTHLSIGQEASGVASCMALDKGDKASLSHRGHSAAIGFGVDLKKMMAELLGRANGYCKGKGGSMHIADIESGNLGANGIVGGGFSISVGAALSQQYMDTGKVVLCFAGDGATNEGNFHESLNLASIWKLPVIFYIENNLYAMSNPIEKHMNITDIADRAASYGMPGVICDGNDVFDVYQTIQEAAKHCREGKGPVLVESKTYRWDGHSKSDAQAYRTMEERKEWMAKDPILRLRNHMIEEEIATAEEIDAVDAKAKQDIEEAFEFAWNSPEPDVSTLTEDVYA